MRDNGVRVRAICRQCRTAMEVDVGVLCTVRARSFSLIGAKGRCKIVGCGGEVFFTASPHEGTPFRPLTVEPEERSSSKASKPEPPDDDGPGYPPPIKMGLSW